MATKTDKNGQIETLSIEQENAIDLLIQGKTDGDTGAAVGVTRQTVNGWKNHDAAFIAELNARRREIFGAHGERLRALVSKAVDVLEDSLTAEDPKIKQAAAVHILRAANLYGVAIPDGPTTPQGVKNQWENQMLDEITGHAYQ